ncbi:ABC transporter ATP-binding protein [Paracraurococcus ruber]|uniref:Fe3+/spermidine/putrescine ABC transporter ATP-binding protein n=1 Tax=Paracraurococcus ruber TaxID=77675 RepID=A0ABS1CU14_9PROT|nr:ABC transporter ATP-binding protein [Paracraurococcus ruber]MBK1657968.1 Fe3+/spermidine/putrescine ABC transporter ATP-binding protein [Paracraurococcus ruber]TDG30386.1 ABC transporter ATP-binding protein [Paracraurococcus ruber]
MEFHWEIADLHGTVPIRGPAAPARGAIEFAAVTKRFPGGAIAVDALDLRIRAGSYVCLLGPSGCGKTTTLRLLAGHEHPTTGDILLDDANIVGLPPARRGTAMMFQSYALFPHLSVLDNVAFSLRMRGTGKADRHARAHDALRLVEMDTYAARMPAQLSGGQQQRVALARALVTNPATLLLDEPLSALDPFLRGRVRAELKRFQRELQISFVHVTHSQDEALALADHVVLMRAGRIEQQGTPEEIFDRPRTAFAARFMGGHNVFTLGDGRLVAVRSDRTQFAAAGQPATVTGVEYTGTGFGVTLAGPGGEEFTVALTEAALHARPVAPGDPVHLAWDEADTRPLEGGA